MVLEYCKIENLATIWNLITKMFFWWKIHLFEFSLKYQGKKTCSSLLQWSPTTGEAAKPLHTGFSFSHTMSPCSKIKVWGYPDEDGEDTDWDFFPFCIESLGYCSWLTSRRLLWLMGNIWNLTMLIFSRLVRAACLSSCPINAGRRFFTFSRFEFMNLKQCLK